MNMKMSSSDSIKDFSAQMLEITNQMNLYGDTIFDKQIVEKMLIFLLIKFGLVVTAIEQSKDISTMSVTELVGALEAHEQRMNKRNESSTEKAYQSKHKQKTSIVKERKKWMYIKIKIKIDKIPI